MTQENISIVNTLELKVGDIVKAHGAIWKLLSLNKQGVDKYGNWLNFKAEAIEDKFNLFVKSKVNDFIIQGNQNKTWFKCN